LSELQHGEESDWLQYVIGDQPNTSFGEALLCTPGVRDHDPATFQIGGHKVIGTLKHFLVGIDNLLVKQGPEVWNTKL